MADRKNKTPISRSFKAVETLAEILFSKGLLVWFNSGQVDGEIGDVLTLGPPLTTTREQVDEMMPLLRAGLEDWILLMKKQGASLASSGT